MEVFNFLPSRHDARATADADVSPHCIEVAVVNGANVVGLIGEGCKLVALEVVVMVGHRVGEAADYGFGDI